MFCLTEMRFDPTTPKHNSKPSDLTAIKLNHSSKQEAACVRDQMLVRWRLSTIMLVVLSQACLLVCLLACFIFLINMPHSASG